MESIKSLVDKLHVLDDIKSYDTQLVSEYKKRLKRKGYTQGDIKVYAKKMQDLFYTALLSNHNAVILTPWRDIYDTYETEADLKIMNDATYGRVIPVSSPVKDTHLVKFSTSDIKGIEGNYEDYIRRLQTRFSYMLPDIMKSNGMQLGCLSDWYDCFQAMSSVLVRYLVYSIVYKRSTGTVELTVYEPDIPAVNYILEALEDDLGVTVSVPKWSVVCSDTDLYKVTDLRCEVPCVYEDWHLHINKRYMNRVFHEPEQGDMLDVSGGLPKEIVYIFE